MAFRTNVGHPPDTEVSCPHSRMTFDRFVASLLFVGISVLACLMPAHNDTWWHLRAGYDMLAARSVLLTETFSHTAYGTPWANYEWLGEVIFAAVHRLGGMPLLTAVCAGAVSGGVAFVYASIEKQGMTAPLLLAAIVAGGTSTWSVRPQTFSLLALGLTVWLIRTRRSLWLPLVVVVWANLHGAVAYGAVLVAGLVAGHAWHERGVPWKVLAIAALCAAAPAISPLGLSYWWDIAEGVRLSRLNEVAEWRRTDAPPAHLVFWAIAATLPVAVALRHRRLPSAESKSLACGALLLLPLAALSMRNVPAFLMVAATALSLLLVPRRAVRPERHDRTMPHLVMLGIAAAIALVVVAGTWSNPPERLSWHPMSPAAATAVEDCRGPLYNRFEDGGPIVFFAPEQKVLLDSRVTPYPASLMRHQAVIEVTGDYRPLFEEHGINCAALPPQSIVAARLRADGWQTRFQDPQWVVLERVFPAP